MTENEPDQRQMFEATCSECGVECEVPFEPVKGKPVKCKDCFKKNRFGKKKFHDAKCGKCGKECRVPFKPTEGKEVLCKECYIESKEQA